MKNVGRNSMRERSLVKSGRLLCVALVCAASWPAFAGEDVILLRGKPTTEQILEVLAAPQNPDAASAGEMPAQRRVLRRRGISLNPAVPQEPIETQAARQVERQTALRVERKLDLQILFAFDSDRLTREGMEVLDQLGTALDSDRLNHVRNVTLEGHTDSTGSAAYNLDLSRRRAESVRNYLSSRFGTGGRGFYAVGKGAREPADLNDPGGAINRRVRIIVDG
jgi:outer membrane protein OmpA-like peptidoglycan-associated protein